VTGATMGADHARQRQNRPVANILQINEVLGLASRVHEVGGWFLSLLKRFRRETGDDPAPGDWQARSSAYRRFQTAGLSVFLNLQLLAALGTPPRITGALWTWPTAMRAGRQVLDSFNECLAALYDIALVGDHAVLDAAISVGEVLGQMASSFPARRGGGPLSAEFVQLVEHTGERLVDFAASARADLQKRE
jgi:hypothetical protein